MTLEILARDGSLAEVEASVVAGLPADGGAAALCMAASWHRHDVVRLLLRHGVSPNSRDARGTPVLYTAAGSNQRGDRRGTLTILLEAGADINLQDQALRATPLIRAAWAAEYELMRFLLAHGADPTARNHEGLTARQVSEKRTYVDFCDMFDNTPPSDAAFEAGEALLREAEERWLTRH